jgi:hypothetical protein
MSRQLMSAAVIAVAVVVATAQPVLADMSRPVISAFRGQFVVSTDELPTGKNDKDTIAKIKKAQLKELTGQPGEDNVTWNFHYTAFLTKTGAKNLKMHFMKGKQLAADKQLDGIDPKSTVLSGDITIDENEGLAKGNTYQIELLSGSSVVAKTTLIMK